ncbi:MAG: hypothetical protein WEA61_04840 [Anaerolineales bacterium]
MALIAGNRKGDGVRNPFEKKSSKRTAKIVDTFFRLGQTLRNKRVAALAANNNKMKEKKRATGGLYPKDSYK